MNLAAVPGLGRRPLTGVWYRAIQPHFWKTALSTGHTTSVPSRFGAGDRAARPFRVLYLAENPQVALFEVQACFGSLATGMIVPNPHHASYTSLDVSVVLQSIVDLTLVSETSKIETSAQEMTGDWECYRTRTAYMSVPVPSGVPAPTQELGQGLFDAGDIEGFLTISAKAPWYRNLVVFPSQLKAGSSVVFRYAATGEEYIIDSTGERYVPVP